MYREAQKELTLVLLAAALVLFASVVCNRLSARVGMPVLLAFIFLGMIFGVDGPVGIAFDNYAVTEQVATVALLFIMFYGGFGTNWRAARPVAAPSILLSTAGVAATALLTGVFCRFALGMRMTEGLLVGAVLGSTDAASVFSILRARRLALKENTASMLEIESGSNDPCAYMMTALVLSAMQGGFSVGGALFLLLRQVGLGLALGAGIGLAAIRLLRRLGTDSGGFDMVFVVATAVLAYALPAALGGNGYLSVYLAGILLGNSDIRNKKQLVPFFDGVTSLCQLVLFFLLGLLCTPLRLPAIAGQALAISLFLLLAARPAAVFLLLAPFKASTGQKLLVSWSGLRGAASIVFAVMCGAGVMDRDLFHITFFVVLVSISLQGTLLPWAAKKLDMIDTDADADALRVFTDYTENVPVQFIQFTMTLEHPWSGRALREVVLPPGTILVSLRRGERTLVPDGSTVLRRGDELILCAHAPAQTEGLHLVEHRVRRRELEQGARVCDLPRRPGTVIMLVQRGEDILIPDGSTVLRPGDVLVLHEET